jgi:hypothetical protein
MNKINRQHYGGNLPKSPTGRKAIGDMSKSFYTAEQPGIRPLAKGGAMTNPVDVLDFHMRKASQNKKKRKDPGALR